MRGERMTDADLAVAIRSDPGQFAMVYERHFRDIYRYVAGRLDTQAADDIAADTFLVAFRQRNRFDPGRGGLRPWLFGIATNLVAQHRRQEARHYKTLARAGTEPAVSSHESRVVSVVSAQMAQPQLARALATLPQGERDVILLVALGQLSHDEVAQALGISPGTVGSRLSRGRQKLRSVIDQEKING